MTREEREIYIQKELLNILAQSSRYLLPEKAFYAQACLVISPAPLRAEFDAAIKMMQSNLWITGVLDNFKQPKWTLTDEGRAALA
jgi:hypothetical protein